MGIAECLICLGLVLDILGVVLLFCYGLPSKFPKREDFLQLEQENDGQQDERARERFKRMAHLGLILLMVGFGFQIVGTVFG